MSGQVPREALRGDARLRAAEVLTRTEADGAFAAAALDAAIARTPALGARDRGLATELVYGALRTLPVLDAELARFAKNGAKSIDLLDPWSRNVLRVAVYQVLALDRIPPSAAVDAAVDALKRWRSKGLAGFANAVLRRVAGERPDPLPADRRVTLALRAVPVAVRVRIGSLLGQEAVESVLRAALERSAVSSVRVNPLRIDRDALMERLLRERAGAAITPGKRSPLALSVEHAGDLSYTAAWKEGLFDIQEEGAQVVALMAGAGPGMSVLDLCAGRGGKSAVLATQMAGRGTLHAVDQHPAKLETLRANLARLGLLEHLALETFAVDLTVGDGDLARAAPAGGYDVVMVDAPCSGLGTLAHRPDLMLRLRDAAAWRALTAVQTAVLERAAHWVRPGGVLLYAVCTLTAEEGDAPVEALLAARPGWAAGHERTVLRPDLDGTDGFVIHRIVRAGGG
ncbi:MAG: transcription antitermination factor NusB [Deltaproteobacteria bacterium]|nr:transcription antitermination factor NusB [Myxococcales bacterium]MDP3220753.1 transcription antitermination factor NusB [Deltaproteobacteria bacterium]